LYQDKARDIRDWFQRSRKLVIGIELLFLLAFAAMTFIRMANPDITNTEKPMELAFINAIIRSPTLPPHDPWLAGYAISYYYFGYVLVSMLAVLTSVPVGEAFNLALALTFALGALGAYGIVYNLLAKKYTDEGGDASSEGDASPTPGAIFAAYLAPVFVLIVSNVEGFLEFLHARGLFWTQ
ncbi:MAG: hypothetical protein GY803_29490, partial [Chloroflexi bacterium]|nr:hypothetical protein [Chloroflexota bacterium]